MPLYNNDLHGRHFLLNSRCPVVLKTKDLISHTHESVTAGLWPLSRPDVSGYLSYIQRCLPVSVSMWMFCSPSRLDRQVLTLIAAVHQYAESVSRLEQQFVDPHIWTESRICQWQNYVNYKVADMGVITFMWFRIPSQEINFVACYLLKHQVQLWLIGESH